MERQRSRRNSVSSVHSQSNSSIANVQCSEEHTHAIVQREKDNKVILVPLDYFINFGKTVKVNETATYKSTTDSRKSDRGKVLLFGSEDLCVEQLQVIQEEIVEEEQLPEKKNNKTNSSSTISKYGNREKRPVDVKKTSNNQLQKQNKENYVMDGSGTAKGPSKTTDIDDRSEPLPSKKINSASAVILGSSTRYEKNISQVKRKLFDNNTEFLSTNEDIFEEDDVLEINDCSTKNKFSNRVAGELSAKQTPDVNNQVLSKKLTSTASSSQARSQSVVKPVSSEEDSSDSSDEEEEDGKNQDDFVSKKKYNNLQRKLQNQKDKNKALKNQIKFYTKNYVPLPDGTARTWFINVCKRLGTKLSAPDLCSHAKLININPNVLLGCIQDTGTATARKIIRALFTQEDLEKKSGPDAVSKVLRQTIRDFVEAHHGVISNHQFNESINGVFRQSKQDEEDAQEHLMGPSTKKQKTSHRQQKRHKTFCSKTSTLSVGNKITTISTNTIMDNDDDN